MSKKKKKKEKALKENKKPKEVAVVGNDPREAAVMRLQVLGNRLSSLSTYSDIPNAFKLINQVKSDIGAAGVLLHEEKYYGNFGMGDLYGYRPQGTTFWSLFPNPFGIFAYLAENNDKILCCRNEFYKEIISDGYYKVGNKNSFASFDKTAARFNIEELRAELVDHLKMFGNFWIWPIFNAFGVLVDYKLLSPQYIEPVFTPDGQRILAWKYQIGFMTYLFELDQLWHVTYRRSMRHVDLGTAPLASLLTDIEADMQASMYNNMVFQKGGLIGLAILMEQPRNALVPGTGTIKLAKEMEAELRANHSGARSGFETVVLTGAKDIKQLNNLADLDGAFHKTSDKVGKQVAHVLGVPHERLGIITNANQQYHAASLEDKNALQFDKTIYEVLRIADKFLNLVFLPAAGVKDVQLRAKDRYNQFTVNMSQALVNFGKLDGFISVDEARTDIAKLPPFGGKAGAAPLRVLPNMSTTAEGLPPPTPVPIPSSEASELMSSPSGPDDS